MLRRPMWCDGPAVQWNLIAYSAVILLLGSHGVTFVAVVSGSHGVIFIAGVSWYIRFRYCEKTHDVWET